MANERNKPCRCGSGKKTKFCCGEQKNVTNYIHPITPNINNSLRSQSFKVNIKDAKASLIELLDLYIEKLDNPKTTKPSIERFSQYLITTGNELKKEVDSLNLNANELALFTTIVADPLKSSLFDSSQYPLSAVSIGYKASAEMCKRALIEGIQETPHLTRAIITTTTGWKVVSYDLEFGEYPRLGADEVCVTTNPLDDEDYQLYHLRKKFYSFEEQSLLDLSKLEAIKDTTDMFEKAFDNYAHLFKLLSNTLYREIMLMYGLVGLSPMPQTYEEAFYAMKDDVFSEAYWQNPYVISIFDQLIKLMDQETIDFKTFNEVYDVCMNRLLFDSLNDIKQLQMSDVH